MAAPYKKPKKGRLKAAFIDAAQIVRNILVFEPANKHRVKRKILLDKQAGRDVDYDHYRRNIVAGKWGTYHTYLVAFWSCYGLVKMGGVALPELLVLWASAGVIGTVFKVPALITGGSGRVVRRFERQADKKIKRLTDKQNKKARQLLLNGDI